MKKHKQIYMEYFNLGPDDVVLCEICGAVAVDVHHIQFKSQGGSDDIGNLIGLCRRDHDIAHGKVKGMELPKGRLYEILNDTRNKQ